MRAEIIPFRRKHPVSTNEAKDARMRYLRSIRYDRSQPFEIRMKAAVQLGYEMRKKFYGSWTDPATLTNEQIEAELLEVELKLGKLWALTLFKEK